MNEIKIKNLTKEQLLISADRLTRFKHPEVKYFRVFSELLTSNLIFPKYKKSELEELDCEKLVSLAEFIINSSLSALGYENDNDYRLNQKLYDYEKSVFCFDDNTETFLKNRINYKGMLNLIDGNCAKNLQWLKAMSHADDIVKYRAEHALGYPVQKVIIAEGATEEILLPEFARICGSDFDKNGIYVLSAGGKNRVVKLYYELCETLRLPVFVLLDKDAAGNVDEILPKLRPCDKIHLLKCGEFEDLLPEDLVNRTLEYELKDISVTETEMFNAGSSRVKVLEEIFRNRGRHEFKKAGFAAAVKQNLKSKEDVSAEILEIIEEISNYAQ